MADDKKGLNREQAEPLVRFIEQGLPMLPGVQEAEVCGSWRRGKAVIGDLDIRVLINPKATTLGEVKALIKKVLQLEGVKRDGAVYFDGLFAGVAWCNFWMYDDPLSTPTFRLHCTGSGKFNSDLRGYAKARGYKLSQHGLYRVGDNDALHRQYLAGEEGVFEILGLPYLPPQSRERLNSAVKEAQESTLLALSHAVRGLGHQGVSNALYAIGKAYASMIKQDRRNQYKANWFMQAGDIAKKHPPQEWETLMPGDATLQASRELLASGRCARMDELGL